MSDSAFEIDTAENGRIVFVKTRDIQWIESAGNYARLHVASRNHDIRETLTNLEGRLNPREFVRIHRSTIVNVNAIAGVVRDLRGHTQVRLKRREELLAVSDAYTPLFRQM